MRYGDLTYEEIRERAGQDWLAIVPTGCTEQQGPHLPVDFDTWFVEQICTAAAEKADREHRVESLVLPTIPFGPTPEHRNYAAGYVDVPVDLHDSLVLAILASLAEQGFRRIVVWRGCGGHDLRETVERFNETCNLRSTAFLPGLPYHNVWCRIADPSIPGGHADSFTTVGDWRAHQYLGSMSLSDQTYQFEGGHGPSRGFTLPTSGTLNRFRMTW